MKQSRYPLATNISATSGSDTLLGLNEGKTRNFKISDIVSLAVNSVYISAQDVTSESINIGLTSGYLPWNRLINIPFASSATSGILTPEDYIILMESGSGGSSSALTNSTITFGNGISATTIYVSANPVVGLNSIVSPGTSIKISYDSYGRVLSGESLTSADIPNIDMSKVISGQLDWNRLSNVLFATSSSNGIITSSDWNTFNNKVSNLNILSAYLPLSGGILTGSLSGTNISATDITTNHLHTDYLDFNLSALPSYNTGRLHWDNTDKTLNLDLDDGTVLQIGQETLIRGQNNTGATILNGSLVYINGASGNRATFGLADADIVSAGTVLAIATHDIANNNSGFFTTFGLVRELNTSQFSEGAELFLSTSAGIFTNVEPSYPNKKCSIGYVIRSHATQGSIFFDTKHISKYDQSITTPTELNYVSNVSANIQTQLNDKFNISGGLINGNLSATSLNDINFIGNKVLVTVDKTITESNISNVELSYLSNLSGNIQTQLNQLSQNSLSGTGAGTVGRISKFITSSSVGDSSISDNGSLVIFSTPITINGDISATTFTGLASRAISALSTDSLKTARNFSISGDISSNIVSFDGTGNVVLSGTITNLSASKILQDTTHRFVTDTQITSWNNSVSGTSAIVDLESSLIIEANKNKLYFLSGATTNITSALPNDLSFTKYLSPIFSGKREKTFNIIGPSSGSYQATVVFYGTDANRSSWVYPDNCIIGTINNSNNTVSADFSNKFTVWGASLTIDSGTIPFPGVSATVEV